MVSGHLDREKKSTNSNSPTKWFFWNHSIGFPSICLDCPWVSWDFFWIQQNKAQTSGCFFINQLTSWFLWTASWSHGFFEPPLEVMVSLKAFVAVLFEWILKQTLTNSLRLVLSFNCQKFQIDFYEISLTYVYKNHILIYVFFQNMNTKYVMLSVSQCEWPIPAKAGDRPLHSWKGSTVWEVPFWWEAFPFQAWQIEKLQWIKMCSHEKNIEGFQKISVSKNLS